jgi:hypothetical protein
MFIFAAGIFESTPFQSIVKFIINPKGIARLTIGIKASEKHVQYCVNKIEVKEKKPTVPSNSN